MSSETEYVRPSTITHQKIAPFIRARNYRRRMGLLTLLSDLAGFAQAVFYVYLANRLVLHRPGLGIDSQDMIILGVCLALLLGGRLYPGVGLNPATEMKLVTKNLAIGGTIGLVAILVLQGNWWLHVEALLLILVTATITVLFSRWSLRWLAGQMGLWGEPVVVIGNPRSLAHVLSHFSKRLRLGMIPVMAVAPEPEGAGKTGSLSIRSLKRLLNSPADHFREQEIYTVLIDISVMTHVLQADPERTLNRLFRRVVILSDLDLLDGAALSLHDFEGMVGIEAHKNGLSRLETFLKRAIDICGVLLLGLLSLPAWLSAWLAIALQKDGPVFYTQERVGRDGQPIRIYKFRTMVADAEPILQEYLALHPAAQMEWEQTQKLQADPRITRPGKWIRRYSLDELPQLWNVLNGEMSLVGPRPMLAEQVKLYGDKVSAYCNVRPGITGMWQVSGRNGTTFSERTNFDTYYIRNWSLWLDLYILLRTVWVVLSRDGAY